MSKATRIGDGTTGTCDKGFDCCPHSRAGTNSSGSPNVYFNNKAAHRLGDSGNCNCPHGGTFTSTSGSRTVFINNKPATRIGDNTVCNSCGCGGNHSAGSNNIFIGS